LWMRGRPKSLWSLLRTFLSTPTCVASSFILCRAGPMS
jgi:hypothetical protein